MHKKGRIPEQRQGIHHTAAGIKQPRRLIGKNNARRLTITQMIAQHIGTIVQIDNDLGDPRGGQPVQRMIDQRPAGNFDQRFRRADPSAAARARMQRRRVARGKSTGRGREIGRGRVMKSTPKTSIARIAVK